MSKNWKKRCTCVWKMNKEIFFKKTKNVPCIRQDYRSGETFITFKYTTRVLDSYEIVQHVLRSHPSSFFKGVERLNTKTCQIKNLESLMCLQNSWTNMNILSNFCNLCCLMLNVVPVLEIDVSD